MDIATLVLPALVPALADGVRGIFARLTGGKGALPQNVDEQIKLMQAQTERVRALAEIDALSPNASAWVADLRGSFRYVAIGLILLVTGGAAVFHADPDALAVLVDMSGASMAFIIGERMYLGLGARR